MDYQFKPCDRSQRLMLPPSLEEWLPEGHLARFIVDAVGPFELGEFMAQYRSDGTGQAAFHPAPVLALLLYWYCKGERSSRKIESCCEDDVASRFIMANQKPDHSMFCRFRVRHQSAIAKVFVQVLQLCEKAGLVKLGSVSLDGTKIKASAALDANRKLDALEAEVQKMLAEAAAVDAREDALFGADKRGDELPPDLRDAKGRKKRLQECAARLKAEQAAARSQQQEKIDTRKEEEAASGKKRRGRKPKPPDEVVDKDQKANTTDPDSRIMKTRSGYVQGYNAQALVSEEQIVIAADVTQEENDQKQLKPVQNGGRCMRRGLQANRSEWRFTCSAHNLLKLWRSTRKPGK